jgi:(1->4)-alpha-D-glucan 1-alpha-D-glucosylmutase
MEEAETRQRELLVRIPNSTCRLQFNRRFTFEDAGKIFPYLHKLGISDVYSSPLFQAHPSSEHGYDVSNYNRLNPILGSSEEFDAMVATLQKNGMGLIVDFVPNHMGTIDPRNEWWMDVLENGPRSLFARFFDIDWESGSPALRHRILLRVLDLPFGRVLESGQFKLRFDEGRFCLTYADRIFPLNPDSYEFILKIATDVLRWYSDKKAYEKLESIRSLLADLGRRPGSIKDKMYRQCQVRLIKQHLAQSCSEHLDIASSFERAMRRLEGNIGDAKSFDQLEQLLSAQYYRLSYGRATSKEVNYRRFLDAYYLAAIRVEDPVVFEATHKLLFKLLKTGHINGLRIDHVDGLQNPKQYLTALQNRFSELREMDTDEAERPLYLIVEKIPCMTERLRTDWPVHGTTGYEFTADVTQLLVESSHEDALTRVYTEYSQESVDFDVLLYEKKKRVMDAALSRDIDSLSHRLSTLAERSRLHCDFALDSLGTALRELIAVFPEGRPYVSREFGVSDLDREMILCAIGKAKRQTAAPEVSIFDFLQEILLLEGVECRNDRARQIQWEFILRFQQCLSAVITKAFDEPANRSAAGSG